MTVPSAPKGAKAGGRRLWRSLVAEYTFEEHELALLREAVRCVDQLDDLAAAVALEGAVVDGKPHPGLVEARQLRLVLARLLAAMRLPSGDEGDRPQRRGAPRGVYRKQDR